MKPVRALVVAGMILASVVFAAGPTPTAATPAGCVVDLADALGWWAGEDTLAAKIGPDLSGTVGFTTAHVGRGMDFGSTDDLSAAAFPPAVSGVTVEAWIRPDPARRGWAQALLSRWNFVGGTNDDAYALVLTGDDLIFYADTTSLVEPDTVSATAPQLWDGAFHHVAATWGDGAITLYVDGTAVGADATRGVLSTAPATAFRVGSAAAPGRLPSRGVIDEPAVFGRALSSEEIEAIHAAGPDGKCPGGFVQEATLTATDAAADDQFGYSVDVDGDTAVVGAYFADHAGDASGSAYVYTRVGGVWSPQATLVAADGAADDLFGTSVAVDGDTIVVGAYLDDDGGSGSGSAYVFTRADGIWTQQAKLTAADASSNDNFGVSVAVDGDIAIVGAMAADAGTVGSAGAAHVFARSGGTWIPDDTLTAPDAGPGDRFGYAVDLAGTTAVVGAYRDDDAGSSSGSAHVFVRGTSGWGHEAKLTAADGAGDDVFGFSVAVDADRAVVGAMGDDDLAAAAGAAYVFDRAEETWTESAKLTVPEGAAGDQFGNAVDVAADTVLVGAPYRDETGTDSGSAYVFTFDGIWRPSTEIAPANLAPGDFYGYSAALDAATAVVGGYLHDDVANAAGAAWIFTRTG